VLGDVRGRLGCILCQKRLKLSWKVEECKPLPATSPSAPFVLYGRTPCAAARLCTMRCHVTHETRSHVFQRVSTYPVYDPTEVEPYTGCARHDGMTLTRRNEGLHRRRVSNTER